MGFRCYLILAVLALLPALTFGGIATDILRTVRAAKPPLPPVTAMPGAGAYLSCSQTIIGLFPKPIQTITYSGISAELMSSEVTPVIDQLAEDIVALFPPEIAQVLQRVYEDELFVEYTYTDSLSAFAWVRVEETETDDGLDPENNLEPGIFIHPSLRTTDFYGRMQVLHHLVRLGLHLVWGSGEPVFDHVTLTDFSDELSEESLEREQERLRDHLSLYLLAFDREITRKIHPLYFQLELRNPAMPAEVRVAINNDMSHHHSQSFAASAAFLCQQTKSRRPSNSEIDALVEWYEELFR